MLWCNNLQYEMNLLVFFNFFLYEINTVVFIAYFCAAWRIKLPQGDVEWWVARANANGSDNVRLQTSTPGDVAARTGQNDTEKA